MNRIRLPSWRRYSLFEAPKPVDFSFEIVPDFKGEQARAIKWIEQHDVALNRGAVAAIGGYVLEIRNFRIKNSMIIENSTIFSE